MAEQNIPQPPQQPGGGQQPQNNQYGGYPQQGGYQQGGPQQAPKPSPFQGISKDVYKKLGVVLGVGVGAAVVSALIFGFLFWAVYDENTSFGGYSVPDFMRANFFSFMHLPAAGFRNALHYGGSTLAIIPLSISVLTLLAMWFFGRKLRATTLVSNWIAKLVIAAASGLVFWGVLVILSAIFAWAPGHGSAAWAGSFGGAVYTLVTVGGLVWFLLSPKGIPDKLNIGVGVRLLLEHLAFAGVFALILGLIGVLAAGEFAPKGILFVSILAGVPNVIFSFFNTIYLGSLSNGYASAFGYSTYQWWEVLIGVIVSIIALVIFAIRWAARGQAAAPMHAMWRLPAIYAAGGLFMLFALYTGKDAGMTAGLGLAGWNFMLLAVVGAIIEVLARFVVPASMGFLPGTLLSWINVGIPEGPQNFQQLGQVAQQRRQESQARMQQMQQQMQQQGQQYPQQNPYGYGQQGGQAPMPPQQGQPGQFGQPQQGGQAPMPPQGGQAPMPPQQGGQAPQPPQNGQGGQPQNPNGQN